MREYFKYTLAAISVSIAIKLAIFYTDPLHQGWGRLYMMVAPVCTVLALYPGMLATRNKEFGGYISGKLATAAGVRIAVISGGINGLFDYCYYSFINKGILPARLAAEIDSIKALKLDKFQLDNAIGGASKFFTPFMQTTFPMFLTIALGFFFMLIFAYIIRRSEPGEASQGF